MVHHQPENEPWRTVPGRRILVVDDDPHIREVLRFALERGGFEVDEAGDGRSALEQFHRRPPDLVVLDILMPELDGTDVCRRLRAGAGAPGIGEPGPERGQDRQVPIIFLSSKSDEIDRVLGLELGGDDYVTKPFSPRELVARVRAVLRRGPTLGESAGGESGGGGDVLQAGSLYLDAERFELRIDGRPVPLTVTEFGLIQTLMSRPGKVFTRDELMQRAYREHVVVEGRTINTHIKRLRRKLAAAGAEPIETVHGLGYRLASPERA